MKIRLNTPSLMIDEQVPWFAAITLFVFIMGFATPDVLQLLGGDWAGLVQAVNGQMVELSETE